MAAEDVGIEQGLTLRQQVIGVSLVVSVAFIWVGAAEFIQFIFDNQSSNYDKPYTLSYVCVSMFVVFLFGFFLPSWRSTYSAIRTSENEEPSSTTTSNNDNNNNVRLSFNEHLTLAGILAPLFFLCNYTYNLGLSKTSVASSSIIATLTSVFTLILGATTGVENFSVPKCIAAFLSVLGASIIILVDDKSSQQPGSNPLLGDTVAILSSFIYAVYTTILKSKAPEEDSVNVAMLLSFIGLFTALGALPGIAFLDWTSIESFVKPSPRTALFLIINALIGTVLSDFLWALSVVLTTPLLTTLSLSLTVPLSMLVDVFWNGKSFTAGYFVGATLVFSGFVLVNKAMADERTSRINT